MQTNSPEMIRKIANLARLIEARKDAEIAEKEMKQEIKKFMGREAVLEAGDWCVLITNRSRKDLDKDGITEEMGFEWIQKFMRLTNYEILEIKKKVREILTGDEPS